MTIKKITILAIFALMAGCGRPEVSHYFGKSNDRDLVNAALDGKKNKVRQILLKGLADVNCRGWNGITPLLVAVGQHNKNAVLLLLENKADPNQQDDDGYTPISLAASSDDPWFLKTIIKNGGNVNFKNKYGQSPIWVATLAFSKTNVDTLIELGANLDVQDGTGTTPMIDAANLNHYDFVYYLLSRGADPKLKDNWGYTVCFPIQHSRIDPNSPRAKDREKVIAWLKENKAWQIEEKKTKSGGLVNSNPVKGTNN